MIVKLRNLHALKKSFLQAGSIQSYEPPEPGIPLAARDLETMLSLCRRKAEGKRLSMRINSHTFGKCDTYKLAVMPLSGMPGRESDRPWPVVAVLRALLPRSGLNLRMM